MSYHYGDQQEDEGTVEVRVCVQFGLTLGVVHNLQDQLLLSIKQNQI